jgi:hypothetical protein
LLVFGLVVLVVFLIGFSLLPMLFGVGYWGMGPGMMGTEIPPDIRYHNLVEEEHEAGEAHPPYTDEADK